MNCNQLQWFCRAYETQSFAKAAKDSFVSRQAFGKAIKCMENELGCALFQRTEQGVAPTEAAQRIYPIVQRCVGDLRSVRKICGEHAPGVRQPVRIAIADGVVETMDDFFFDELERMNPACDIIIDKHFYVRCMDYLKEERVDFAIAPGPVTDSAFTAIPIARERAFVIAAPETVNFSLDDPSIEDLATLDFFKLGTGEQAMLGLDALFDERGLEWRKIDQYTEYGILMRKVHAGVASILAPENVLPSVASNMVVIPLPPDLVSWTINCFWLPRELSTAEEGIVEFMRAHAIDGAPVADGRA